MIIRENFIHHLHIYPELTNLRRVFKNDLKSSKNDDFEKRIKAEEYWKRAETEESSSSDESEESRKRIESEESRKLDEFEKIRKRDESESEFGLASYIINEVLESDDEEIDYDDVIHKLSKFPSSSVKSALSKFQYGENRQKNYFLSYLAYRFVHGDLSEHLYEAIKIYTRERPIDYVPRDLWSELMSHFR